MIDKDRIEKMQARALKAEAEVEQKDKMIAWLARRLAQSLGKAVDSDGNEICYFLPPELREGLCSRGTAGCAECWADTAEGEVNGLEYYLKPEYQGRGLCLESAQEFMTRKRREARAGGARVLDFNTGRLRGDDD